MEAVHHCASVEQARNDAIRWLEGRKVVFGPHRKVEIGRLGAMTGAEVGVSATEKPFWRIRVDFDPVKGPHFNVEHGDGLQRTKAAFLFPGTEKTMEDLARQRRPR